MHIGTLMMIIAAVALVLAAFLKLSAFDGWFLYGFFLTSFVVSVFMGLVIGQAWLVGRVLEAVEDRPQPTLRLHRVATAIVTLVLYLVVPAMVSLVAGVGTWLIVTKVMGLFVSSG